MQPLRQRFEYFVSTLTEFEDIEGLKSQCNLPGRLWADYLIFYRRAILEQKSIEQDVADKLTSYLDKLIAERGILAWGRQGLSRLLSILPDGDKQMINIMNLATRRIEKNISDADKQIRDTRLTFVIQNTLGVVVILNEHAKFISPHWVRAKAHACLRKKEGDKLRYQNVQVVIVISEAHRVVEDNSRVSIPVLQVYSEAAELQQGDSSPSAFAHIFTRLWADFNGAPYLEASGETHEFTPRDGSLIMYPSAFHPKKS